MAVSGTINVNLSAIDAHTEEGVESEKKVALSSADNLASAVIAVASGTVGTTAVNLDFSNFRGADGNLVDFGGINGFNDTLRVAFAANPAASLKYDSGDSARELRLHSGLDIPSVSLLPRYPDTTYTMSVQTFEAPNEDAYTASYTVLMLKDAIEYPLRALHAGGILRYTIDGVTQFVSPRYEINGLASPNFDDIVSGIADLSEFGRVSAPETSLTVDINPAQSAYLSDNPDAEFAYASIEAILVDARNIVFGWAIKIGSITDLAMIVSAHVFEETSVNWVIPNGGGGANAYDYPINPYLPLRPYRKLF